jgi:hypothetical protein
MEPNNSVEWKETAPGIWTRVPDDEASLSKGPVRSITSLTENQLPPGTIRQPGKRRILPMPPAAARK